MPIKRTTTWILIADATRARIVKNDGAGQGTEAIDGMVFRSEHRGLKDIFADRPGRSFDSAGPGRHAIERGSDAVREDEQAFAKSLGTVLQKALDRKDYDRVILIAPPRMLGDLRAALPSAVRDIVHAEVGKDLTHVPNPDLLQHLKDVLFV